MNEQWINDTCMMFDRAFNDIDMNTVRNILTLALERGMPIERVSHMLGHESIETTQIYLDLTEDGMHEAHRKYVC